MNSIETQVLRLIAEDTTNPDVFVNTSDGLKTVRDSLNDAIEELCMITGHYRRKYLMPCMEARGLYRLSPQADEIGWVISVWDRSRKLFLDQTDLGIVANIDPNFLGTDGPPQYWWQMGVYHIGLFPRPPAKGLVLEIEMISVPLRYQHDQSPIRLRDQWQSAAVFRAVSEFFASRGDANRAAEWFSRYMEMAQIMSLNPDYAERVNQFSGGWQRRATAE
jgi:hypothetical protein